MTRKQEGSAIRALLIGEHANPEWTSVPLIGWSHWRALSTVTSVHLATQIRNKNALLRAGIATDKFTAIDSERVAQHVWRVTQTLRGGTEKGWTIVRALSVFSYWYFEHLVWKQFKQRIIEKEFNLVHRITPVSPTTPSPLAKKCAKAGVPFVLGPLNGGLSWPKEFENTRRQEREWLGYLRPLHKLMPGHRSTQKYSAAIVVGSQATLREIPSKYHDKCIYVPENGIDANKFTRNIERYKIPPLRIAFVGRLVPLKGVDILLEAATPFIHEGRLNVDVIGDGPQLNFLIDLVTREKISDGVNFRGAVAHDEVRTWLEAAHVLGFPSIHDFGGAVVLESMSLGVVPIVVDYGGPGELVTRTTGFKVPIGSRAEIVNRFRDLFAHLLEEPTQLTALSEKARKHVLKNFTWDVKARQMIEIYRWVLGLRSKKPGFGMPLGD